LVLNTEGGYLKLCIVKQRLGYGGLN